MLYLNGSEFSRQICPLVLSYLGLLYKEVSFEGDELMSFGALEAPPIPFLPLLWAGGQWVSGELAICEFACSAKAREDLLGRNSEDRLRIKTVTVLCEALVRSLLGLERKGMSEGARNRVIEREVDPVLSSFDLFIRGRKGFVEYLTLPDFYLYVILVQLNAIYEDTARNYFWLQKFKVGVDMLLAERMAGNPLSPALKGIKKEIEKDWKMESSEVLDYGKIPFESRAHEEFMREINQIPESFCQSLRMNFSPKLDRSYQAKA